jgi:thioredoxin-like negative regulator of GroEL
MEPIVDGLEKKYSGDFSIKRVNADKSAGKKLARKYGIIGQPNFVLFDQDGNQVRKLMGAQSAETFEREIERILAE